MAAKLINCAHSEANCRRQYRLRRQFLLSSASVYPNQIRCHPSSVLSYRIIFPLGRRTQLICALFGVNNSSAPPWLLLALSLFTLSANNSLFTADHKSKIDRYPLIISRHRCPYQRCSLRETGRCLSTSNDFILLHLTSHFCWHWKFRPRRA